MKLRCPALNPFTRLISSKWTYCSRTPASESSNFEFSRIEAKPCVFRLKTLTGNRCPERTGKRCQAERRSALPTPSPANRIAGLTWRRTPIHQRHWKAEISAGRKYGLAQEEREVCNRKVRRGLEIRPRDTAIYNGCMR